MSVRLRSAIILALAIGMIGVLASLIPFVVQVEQNAGLGWLFWLRGSRPAPSDVVVVSIEEETVRALGVPTDPAGLPRSTYAALLRRLTAAGARLVVFDVFFGEEVDPDGTAELAEAMRRAGNVVLNAHLKQSVLTGAGPNPADIAVSIRLQLPVQPLLAEARAVAPFPLPVVPVKVSQFWAFQEGSGDHATLPAAVLQAVALREAADLLRRLRELSPAAAARLAPFASGVAKGEGLAEFMLVARNIFLGEPGLGQRLRRQVQAESGRGGVHRIESLTANLIGLYTGPASYFLNYYGPPGSIATVPYDRLVADGDRAGADGSVLDLRGRIVFVGFSARTQPQQRDGFFSVFSRDDGLNLSGVEIAATGTANLIEGRLLQPMGPVATLALVLAWGLFLGALCRSMPGLPGVAAGVVSGALYVLTAAYVFAGSDIWMPVMVPVFLQMPLAVLGALLLQYRHVRDQRARVIAAMGRYVPPGMVDRLAEESAATATVADVVQGTCMATDASQYTLMAETMSPDELGRIMNAYYQLLFAEVERHHGQVSDVVGDAMMAIWASSRPRLGIRMQACHAALAIVARLDTAQAAGERAALPTRIGLHSGEIRLGNIGAGQHLEYRAVGDIVNTASRIEGLNKLLRTRVLISAETLVGVAGLRTREIGTFLLAGKTVPVVIHELRAVADGQSGNEPAVVLFADALAEFRSERWTQAGGLFRRCIEQDGADGVAAFYVELCERYLVAGARSFSQGAVRIDGK